MFPSDKHFIKNTNLLKIKCDYVCGYNHNNNKLYHSLSTPPHSSCTSDTFCSRKRFVAGNFIFSGKRLVAGNIW